MANWKEIPLVLPAKLGRKEHGFTCADPLAPIWKGSRVAGVHRHGGTGELLLVTALKELLEEFGYKNCVHLRNVCFHLLFCFVLFVCGLLFIFLASAHTGSFDKE